ncbi:hypothetical protein F7230_09650 [Corynebacterium sp. 320]|uniref:restriction endonuclease subunit S n=1 Tax=Corynebacterium TaxID=1716 RepID=UPI00125CB039|nr:MULTISPECIES: restriction endonuclease subunit S [Corynebacterium]KAB1501318.1 hypothetical protein F7230_09650 [Corynebacterium sp. 320]KAB1551487.1 hypothetical protein F7233_08320 [Corynebacterium sp. 321]KAB1551685.1 hypothetical protein F7232_05955 [Corynebacterium sp. 319]KAB3525683.1 hypothetical protein F8354_09650 [Corynebacterium sp. 250]KAB3538675.1 hypothetical protein F8390_06510 [Corynebacterium sp. 366]
MTTTHHDWPMVKLGDVCDISIGKTPSRKNPAYWGSGHPWLSIKDMNQGSALSSTAEQITDLAVEETRPRLCDPGTVLFSFKLTIGKVGVSKIPLYTNEAIAALLPKDRASLSNGYLFHAMSHYGANLEGSRAVMGQTLNKKSLGQVEFPLPPLEEQHRIAVLLDETVHNVQATQNELSNLLLLKQSEIERFILGKPQCPLSHYVEGISSGKSLKEATSDNVRNRVLKVSSVTTGEFLPEESKPLPDDYEPAPQHAVSRGDILVSRANTMELVGASALIKGDFSNLYLPDKLWRLELKDTADPSALVGILQHRQVRARISAKATGSGGSMKNITQSAFLQIQVPELSSTEQHALAATIQGIEYVTGRLQEKLGLLKQLQAVLSTRAFQGEL